MSAARTLVTAGAALFFFLHSAAAVEAAQLGWGNGRGPVTGYVGTDEIDRAIVSAIEGTDASVGGASAGSSTAPADCHWVTGYQAVEETRRLRPGSIALVGVERVERDGTRSRLYARVCAGQIAQWRWVQVSDHGAVAAELAQEVRRRLPALRGRFSPDLTTTPAVVHVPLWFAVPGQWVPVDASARTSEVTLTVTATPAALRFEPGDGARPVACPGPGEVYEPGAPEPEHPPACSYTYTDASSIAPHGVWAGRLLIDWEVTWAASDGQTGTLPPNGDHGRTAGRRARDPGDRKGPMMTAYSAAVEDVDQDQDEWTPHDPDAASPFGGLRRRWGGAAAALLLMLVGAAGAVWLASGDSGRSVEVVTLTRPLARGTEVTPSDLAVVRVDVEGSGVRLTAPAAARGELVGRQALIDLPAGTLISPEMVGSVALPAGTVTLGVTVSAEDLPSAALRPGERVSVLGYPPPAGGPQLLARGVTVTEVQRPTAAGAVRADRRLSAASGAGGDGRGGSGDVRPGCSPPGLGSHRSAG